MRPPNCFGGNVPVDEYMPGRPWRFNEAAELLRRKLAAIEQGRPGGAMLQ